MKPTRPVVLLLLSLLSLASCGNTSPSSVAPEASPLPPVSSSTESLVSSSSEDSRTVSSSSLNESSDEEPSAPSSSKITSSSSENPSSSSESSSDLSSSSASQEGEAVSYDLLLDGTHGKVTHGYNDSTENTITLAKPSGGDVVFSYLSLMNNTVNSSGFAQFKKNTSYLYNKDALPGIYKVSATLSRSGNLRVAFGSSLTSLSNPVPLTSEVIAPKGTSYLRISSPGGASMVDSIQISYYVGEPDVWPDPTSGTSTSGTSSYSWSSGSSSETRPEVAWDVDKATFGETFLVSLASQINATRIKTTSYDNCLDVGIEAAAYPTKDSKTFIPFYHEAKDGEQVVGGVNREHTWPNSRGSGKKGMGADPIMVRPTLSSENNSRSNKFYGNEKSNEWDPAACGYEGARGESARIILYCATAYYSQGFRLSNNPGDDPDSKTMGTLKTLLKWNREYAPTAFEKLVTERYYQMGFARNAFVDHPEYADYIYDDNGFRTSALIA